MFLKNIDFNLSEITDRYEILKQELVKLILERDNLVNNLIPNIEAQYQLKIGFLEYEKFKLNFEINKMKRTIEIIQAKINRNESINLFEVEKILENEFNDWESKLNEFLNKINFAKTWENSPSLNQQESEELVIIYRKIVKLLHPDINPGNYSKNKDLWMKAFEAYKNSDLNSLKTILIIVEDLSEEENLDYFYFEKRMEQIKDSIKSIIKEINDIKSTPPYIWIEKLKDNEWIREKQENLRKEIKKLTSYKEQIEKVYEKYLESIL